MTDASRPLDPADAEALSAYLSGEMAPGDVAAFEARLHAEPALAAAADALAQALTLLNGADEATPPEGFEQRLAQRLDDERRSTPADLAAHRQRREGRSRMWLGIGTAAAVLAAGAVMSATVLRGMGGQGGSADTVAMDGAEYDESQAQMESSDLSAGGGGGAAPVDGPVILDEQVVVADEDALRRRYADLPEAGAVLGLGVAEARPVAEQFEAVVEGRDVAVAEPLAQSDAQGGDDGEAFGGSGSAPTNDGSEAAAAAQGSQRAGGADTCLATITAGAPAPLVPVRVESLRYDGTDAIAYVLVTASPKAQSLDRTEVWVVAPDCSTLVFQQY